MAYTIDTVDTNDTNDTQLNTTNCKCAICIGDSQDEPLIPKIPYNSVQCTKVINYFYAKNTMLRHICDFLNLTYRDSNFTWNIYASTAIIFRNGEVIWKI